MNKLATLFVLFLALGSSYSASLWFTLFATEFQDCDATSACDLSVTIMCASASSDWQKCGETSKKQNDNNPVWDEQFAFDHEPGTSQRWRFDLKDHDVAFDDTIATFTVSLDQYAAASGNLYQLPMPDGKNGILWIQRTR